MNSKPKKRASYDHEMCEMCGAEFRSTPSFSGEFKCEVIWAEFEGKMILVCDGCKKGIEGVK